MFQMKYPVSALNPHTPKYLPLSGCTTAGKASLVMNVVLLISLLVGGFFVNVASIAAWIRWLHYASVFFYAYTALITNEVATLSLDFVVSSLFC